MKPPEPPEDSKLLLEWNPNYPPAHGDTVFYKCNAGPNYNRYVSDFNKMNYTLTCKENNEFSAPDWPTCIDSNIHNIVHSLKLFLM